MKIRQLYRIVLLFGTTCLVACECDCPVMSDTLKVRLTRQQENAIAGPHAFIDKDSIRFFEIEPFQHEVFIYLTGRDTTLALEFEYDNTYVLDIPGVSMDTFTAQIGIVPSSGCCTNFEFIEVRRNGNVVCTAGCNEIIDLEI